MVSAALRMVSCIMHFQKVARLALTKASIFGSRPRQTSWSGAQLQTETVCCISVIESIGVNVHSGIRCCWM